MDNVADALIRIKNGYLAKKKGVILNYSKLNLAICKVLEKEGYILKVEETTDEKNSSFKKIEVALRYLNSGFSTQKEAAIRDVKKISKPGLRVYKGKNALPRVLNGLGIAIVSTPKGIMTDKDARKLGLGGEVMAYVW